MEESPPTDIEAMGAADHSNQPDPYGERFKLLSPDFVSAAKIMREIKHDPSLSPEQKEILKKELVDRWRAIVTGTNRRII